MTMALAALVALAAVSLAQPSPAPDIVTMPTIIAGNITHADYPPMARRHELTGETRASMTVGADGRVTRCSVQRSSGHAILDERVCAIALERMRLAPARDRDGKAVAANVVLPVQWMIQ